MCHVVAVRSWCALTRTGSAQYPTSAKAFLALFPGCAITRKCRKGTYALDTHSRALGALFCCFAVRVGWTTHPEQSAGIPSCGHVAWTGGLVL